MLCESCFWCASSLLSSSRSLYDLSNDDDTVSKCPICNEYALKLIPIYNKSFTSKVYLESKYGVIIVLLWTMRDKHELAGTEITFVTVAKICGCK